LKRSRMARASKTDPMSKYFVSKTEVLIIDGRIVGYETPLTRPCDKEQAIEGLGRYRRIGIENIHLCKHTTKRYNKLIREYNKRRKEVSLTIADIAQMTALAEAEEKNE
jgi:hypothetical protein